MVALAHATATVLSERLLARLVHYIPTVQDGVQAQRIMHAVTEYVNRKLQDIATLQLEKHVQPHTTVPDIVWVQLQVLIVAVENAHRNRKIGLVHITVRLSVLVHLPDNLVHVVADLLETKNTQGVYTLEDLK